MVDRLYLVANLLTKYIENNSMQDQLPRYVVRPNNVSLGASTEMLWRKFVHVKEFPMSHYKVDVQNNNQLVNKDTQTMEYSQSICSACYAANACVKEIANELVRSFDASATRKIRDDLQVDTYNITQYGCIHRLTTAIVEDVKSVSQQLESLESRNKQYWKDLDHVTLKYSESLKMIKNLEDSLESARKSLKKVKTRNATLMKRINDFIQSDKENKLETETLGKSLGENTVNLSLPNTNNNIPQTEYTQVMNNSLRILHERDMWKNRFNEVQLKNQRIKAKMNEIQTFTNKILNSYEEQARKLEQVIAKIDQKTENSGTIRKSSPVKGGPISDMKKQVGVNLFNIKKP